MPDSTTYTVGDTVSLDEVSVPLKALRSALGILRDELAPHTGSTALAEAQHARDGLIPAMTAVRAAADVLEGVVADDLWPLPTYQEMLFIL